jgi:ribonucleoside-triphosphate reductase
MIIQVVKRDGRRVDYDVQRIEEALLKAQAQTQQKGLKADFDVSRMASWVEEHLSKDVPELEIEVIQDTVEKTLREKHQEDCAKVYAMYRNERSKQREIRGSLMKALEQLTFQDEGSVKRENANIDGNTAMGMMLQYGSQASKRFAAHFLLNPEHAELHESGAIHIHDLDFYAMGTLTCCQIDLVKLFENGFSTGQGSLREPQDIQSYAALAAIAIQSNQNDQHGGQSIPAFDVAMALGVRKTFRSIVREMTELLEDLSDRELDVLNRIELEEKDTVLDSRLKRLIDKAVLKTERRTYQAMEALIHNLNTMHSRAGAQVPFSSLNFGTDVSVAGRMVSEQLLKAQEAGLGNGETPIFPILIFKVKEGINFNPEDVNYDLFRLALRVSAKRLFPNFSFLDASFNKGYYQAGQVETEVTYMGCRTRVLGNQCGEAQVNGRGNLSFTTINLVRLGIESHGDWTAFDQVLDIRLNQVLNQLLARKAYQAKKQVKHFPFLMGQGIWRKSDRLTREDTIEAVLNEGTLSIGFIGLAECLVAMLGHHHGASQEAQIQGLRIVRQMHAFCEQKSKELGLNVTLLATPAEGLAGRFTQLDRKRYGILPGITDLDYYTNSFHVPVHYKCSIVDKLNIEGPYHAITPAGHISYVEIDGDPAQNVDAMEDIVRLMRRADIGYGSINHPLDHDPLCGYRGVIEGNVCPSCGRTETSLDPFQRIRRITGYLVGSLERFNPAKRAEVEARVKHGTTR